jgi:hypothetical protein
MPQQVLLDRIAQLERLVRQLSDRIGQLEDRPRQPQNPYPQMPPLPQWEPRWDQPVIYGPMRYDYNTWVSSHTLEEVNGMVDTNLTRINRERD